MQLVVEMKRSLREQLKFSLPLTKIGQKNPDMIIEESVLFSNMAAVSWTEHILLQFSRPFKTNCKNILG